MVHLLCANTMWNGQNRNATRYNPMSALLLPCLSLTASVKCTLEFSIIFFSLLVCFFFQSSWLPSPAPRSFDHVWTRWGRKASTFLLFMISVQFVYNKNDLYLTCTRPFFFYERKPVQETATISQALWGSCLAKDFDLRGQTSMSEAVTDTGDGCHLDVQPHYIRNRKYDK